MKIHLRHALLSCIIGLVTASACKVQATEVFPIATDSTIESGGEAAFDGSNYLVGVQGGPFAPGVITAQLVSPNGTIVRSGISPGESGGMPHLAFDGTNYFMAWAGSGANPGFSGQFINKSGDLVRGVLRISAVTPEAASVAYGGGKYLACWSDNTRIQGQLVAPDGTLSGPSFTISGSTQEPRENAVVFDGVNFFVVFNGGSGNLPNIYGQVVTPQGSLIGSTVLIDSSPDPSDNPLSVAFDGANYLVIFNDEVGGLDSGAWHVFGRLVSKSGTVSPNRLTIANDPGAQRFPFLAFDGLNYLVAWGGGAAPESVDLVLRYFDREGQPVGSAFSPFTPQGDNRPMYGIPLFDGVKYLVTSVLAGFTNGHDIASADVYGTFVPKSTSPPVPFTYMTNNGTITITGYTGVGGDVTIPSKITGLPVTSIGDSAFSMSWSLTSITIPNSVTTIGNMAFSGSSLTGITIPNSVTSIGAAAFSYCASLTAVTIGDGVTSIGTSAFMNCYFLTAVTIGNSVTNIGNQAFSFCERLASVTIPNNVTGIGAAAFSYCTRLTAVTIGNSVTNIGSEAFEGCASLANVIIPNRVTTIGDRALSGCTNLANITIPNSVTNIGNNVFAGLTSLTGITVDALNPSYSSVDGVLFNQSQSTLIQYPAGKAGSNYTVPSSVTRIGANAFSQCLSLTNVTIPNSVASIGDHSFSYCANLTSVAIGNSVTSIGDAAFSWCTRLSSVIIPSSVINIGSEVFVRCGRLTGAFFQGNAPAVGSLVFSDAYPTVFYLPGTTGWGTTFGGRPTALWLLPHPLILTSGPNFGPQTHGLGFTISWATNLSVVVEACTDLAVHAWSPVRTNTLTNGSSYFSDSEWTNYPARFYRLRSP